MRHNYTYYHHIAAAYGQKQTRPRESTAIYGLEMVARVLWGLIQPRAAQGGRKFAMIWRRPKDAQRTILTLKSD